MAKFWGFRLVSILLVIVGAFLIGQVVDSFTGDAASWKRIIYLCSFYGVLAVSLNLINGITGQFSIGHAGFYQVGAYSAAYTSKFLLAGSPLEGPLLLLVATLVGTVCAGIAGWVIGMPSLRLRGDYLAVATLGFGEIVRILVINQDAPSTGFLSLGGAFGFVGIASLTKLSYCMALLAFTVALCRNLLKTPHGLAFLAIREDEMAADAMGVNTTRYKIWAFVIGASLAGAAGSLLAHFEGFISPDTFKMDVSFLVLTMVVIGGTGSITGSLIAAFGVITLQERLSKMDPIPGGTLFCVAILLILVGVFASRYCRAARPPRAVSILVWSVGILVAAFVGKFLGTALAGIPALATALNKSYKPEDLRMVVFAS